MCLFTRFGVAIVLCLGLSIGLGAVPRLEAHRITILAGRAPHTFPPGSLQLYRPAANWARLQPLDPATLRDRRGPALQLGPGAAANAYPAIVPTADGSRFAVMNNIHPNHQPTASQDLTLQLFDARSGKPLSSAHHPAVPVWISGISADGAMVYGLRADSNLALPCASRSFYLLDARTGRTIRHFTINAAPWGQLLMGPNLHRLYTVTASDHNNACGPQWSYSLTIAAYDLDTGARAQSVRLKGILAGSWETMRSIHGDRIGAMWIPGIALSPDGSQLAVLDEHSDTLTVLHAATLRVAGKENVSRPTTTGDRIVAALGLAPPVADAKGQWNGTQLQLQYTADGHSLLVTGARLHPDPRHHYAVSQSLGLQAIDIGSGQIKAWLDDRKQVIAVWPAPGGTAVYSSVQSWTRRDGWLITLRRHDPVTLRVRAWRTFSDSTWTNLVLLQARHGS